LRAPSVVAIGVVVVGVAVVVVVGVAVVIVIVVVEIFRLRPARIDGFSIVGGRTSAFDRAAGHGDQGAGEEGEDGAEPEHLHSTSTDATSAAPPTAREGRAPRGLRSFGHIGAFSPRLASGASDTARRRERRPWSLRTCAPVAP